MIRVVRPKIGERIYDVACGSAGFLCEAFDFLRGADGRDGRGLTTMDLETLQTRTFFGKEKKSLAYVIAIMNLILHGIEAPNIVHTNTLSENLADIQEKDRFDIVLANPPFGGKERPEVQQNFPIRTGETAFIDRQRTFADSAKSWSVDAAAIDRTTCDLSVKNPNGGEAIAHRSPAEIMEEIAALDAESAEVLGNINARL